ncbi:hypothetical protein BJX63DRAFT_438138 [Aspergillus granulosus]|uniref:Zn(2)-C6 fungal-type domain-containing protein n=1 Tax=Aspergillus granulosus TaxID=176169 RepID=A0ABR4GTC6_9EURO
MDREQRLVPGAEVPKASKPNRRAGQVCIRCHEKKIRCDVHLQAGTARRCYNCTLAGSDCCIRQSKRVKRERCDSVGGIDNNAKKRATSTATYSPSIPRTAVPVSDNLSSLRPPPVESSSSLLDAVYGANSHSIAHTNNGGAAEDGDPNSPGALSYRTYLGSTGYMDMFSEPIGWRRTPSDPTLLDPAYETDFVPEELLDSYADTYFEYAAVWCPILDRDMLQKPAVVASQLLQHSLALCGTRLRPPLIPHCDPESHYKRAKSLFLQNCEPSPVLQIISVMLFWWWSAGYPNVADLDNGRWWLGVAIRLAEDIGLSQASQKVQAFPGESLGLRSRIWWTLFTRDRILAMAQGRPCLINEKYCTVPMVTVDDFSDSTCPKALIFVHWVKLWEIGGNLHQELNWPRGAQPDKATIREKMIGWANTLPPSLRLPFHLPRTTVFNRDIHELHLGYFTIIILLYLRRGEHPIPAAAVPAVAAASCIARIFKEFLARGSVQFILPQATWSIALSILALLSARRLPSLASCATEDIEILYTALARLAPYSNPGKMFIHGIRRILEQEGQGGKGARPSVPPTGPSLAQQCCSASSGPETLAASWTDLFPFISRETSRLVATLVGGGDEQVAALSHPAEERAMTPLLEEIVSESHGFFQLHLAF